MKSFVYLRRVAASITKRRPVAREGIYCTDSPSLLLKSACIFQARDKGFIRHSP